MKALPFLLFLLLNMLQGQSQTNTDSLMAILNNTIAERSNLQQAPDKMEATPPEEIGIIKNTGGWVIKNRNKISIRQQEIQRQIIIPSEKDKQLISIDAMLKGQEEERSRIARDLHDVIGSLLSVTKLKVYVSFQDLLKPGFE